MPGGARLEATRQECVRLSEPVFNDGTGFKINQPGAVLSPSTGFPLAEDAHAFVGHLEACWNRLLLDGKRGAANNCSLPRKGG